MSATKYCSDCSMLLTEGSNWLSSCVRNYKYRCMTCKRADSRTYVRDHNRVRSKEAQENEALRKKQWKLDNKGYVNYIGNERRIAKINRTPKWANLDAIKDVYEECAVLIKRHGPRSYHVDHIVPLKGKNVSGLHVEYNLQILEAIENIKKGNKWNDD